MMLKDCNLIEPLYCKETDSLVDVAKKLREHVIRYIYIVNDKKTPTGVISTTDMNNRVVAEGKDPNTLKAKDIMTKPITSLDENTDINKAYKECIKTKIAICPVTRNTQLIGMVSIEELLHKITHADN